MVPYSAVSFPVRGRRDAMFPGRRPYPVPVQCHPAIPGPLPWALLEEPVGGHPGGCCE
uniref:Uncharacterized protein n=1 Tax=Ailuropoda melanoleuca TaxID=9646 RepID=A0A7N5JKV5_AILME